MVKEDYDGAEPSGNSVALTNLLRLARLTGRAEFRESAEKLLAAFGPRLIAAPVALPQMLMACEFFLSEPREIVLVGDKAAAETEVMVRTFYRYFVPNRVVMLVDSEEARRFLSTGNPAIESMGKLDGRTAAYVCRNYACQLPVSEVGALAELIQ
jgi:uncharacterized protein